MELSLDVHDDGAWSVLKMAGEVDLNTVEGLRQKLADLIEAGRSKLILDLERLDFLDSIGLGALIGARKRPVSTPASCAWPGCNRR